MSASEGVWVVGGWDGHWVADLVFASELEALRVVNSRGYGTIIFVNFGQEIREAALG